MKDIVAVMFKMGINSKTREEQLKGSFYNFLGQFIVVTQSVDAMIQPHEEEIWICEIDTENPITRWTHRDQKSGCETPSMLVAGIPICQIEIPTEIRFGDLSPRRQPCYKVRDVLPDGQTRVAFVPDHKGQNQPTIGQNWRVKPTMVVHTIGTGDNDQTIVIAVECLTRVTATVTSEAWSKVGATVWSPGSNKKTKKMGLVAA